MLVLGFHPTQERKREGGGVTMHTYLLSEQNRILLGRSSSSKKALGRMSQKESRW